MFSVKPFRSILELLKAFPDEQSCIDHLELLRWEGNIVSPFIETSKVYKCTNNRYKCADSNKYFNVRTETIFEGTKIPLQQWFLAIYLFTTSKKGISSYNLANELNITQKSSWFMLSRIRYAMEHQTFTKEMEGVIEVDETFVGGKNKNRHWDKKIKGGQGRGSHKDKTTVLGMIENGDKVKAIVIPDTKKDTIQPIVRDSVKHGSIIASDEFNVYDGLEDNYHHVMVDHGRGQYVNKEGFTTNRIEGFWSHFKRNLTIYNNKVSRKHLQGYVNESVFRYNCRQEDVQGRFNIFLKFTNGRRLTYQTLINA